MGKPLGEKTPDKQEFVGERLGEPNTRERCASVETEFRYPTLFSQQRSAIARKDIYQPYLASTRAIGLVLMEMQNTDITFDVRGSRVEEGYLPRRPCETRVGWGMSRAIPGYRWR